MPTKKWIDLLKRTRPDLWFKRLAESNTNLQESVDADNVAKLAVFAVRKVDRKPTGTLTFAAYVVAIMHELKRNRIPRAMLSDVKRELAEGSSALRDAGLVELRKPENRGIDVMPFIVALERVVTDY
jgi:hypothetical protein